MLAAMERALADGMPRAQHEHRLAFDWPPVLRPPGPDPLVNKGIVVVASIGNRARMASTRPPRPAWATR